ncbi:uncharacterized protein BXZ73DRAFT_49949 [Epithele typhae]|uniref:uncharacterized protein n=1 Tax=Epithele typhae TaxID=378194 RepID=UPI0020076E12|nr:uncharacterized protein BXZ73DRAFT_49949 [Epithele typhae]KAH9925398.1 hypothetical protein BXZ73DRAFT_49949 [Epithele typhae]
MSLLTLSHEMVVHVLSNLHYNDLNTCRRVCHLLNRIIQGSILLQYSMQLQLSGFEDNASSPLVIADKLRLLKQQESAWQRLDFSKPVPVRLPFHPSSIYELSDGIFLLGESTSGLQTGTDIIRWTRLSALSAGPTSDDNWVRICVGAHIIDVGLSVQEHDLVVVATDRESEDGETIFELRLLQLSTGLNHPLAANPVVQLATVPALTQPVAGQCSVCIEIVGDYLCFMFHYPGPYGATHPPAMFEVYDWKTGECLQIREMKCTSYSTFTFLAPDVIALPNCADNTIELCHIGQRPVDDTPLKLEPTCILQLPRLQKGHSIAQVTCRSEPKTARARTHARAFRSQEPFHHCPEQAIVIFNVMTHDDQGWHECLTLIAHTKSLLRTLKPSSPRPTSSSLPTAASPKSPAKSPAAPDIPPAPQIAWTDWGPDACRWLETSFSASRWITTTCGQRYVTVEEDSPDDEQPPTATIVVFDFNPHTIRKLAAHNRRQRRRQRRQLGVDGHGHGLGAYPVEAPPTFARALDPAPPPITFTDKETQVIGQIQCEPTELMSAYTPDHRIFCERVRTGLPYMQLSSYETFGYGAVLLDRNIIIGVKLNDADDIKELVIHSINSGR